MITSAGVDVRGLADALADEVDGEVRFDDGTRAAYATDASNYRQVPIAVVVPRSVEAGVRALEVCRRYATPVLSRGGGTSLAGECCNEAVVIDWSKHCDAFVSLDVDARTCVVEPGIPLDTLNALLAPHHLQFGPKPATHSHCTLGGMIGNDSCGSTAQAYGKTSDNVRRLEIVTYDGTRCWVGPTTDAEYERILSEGGARARLYERMRAIADEYGEEIRARFPDIPRLVSGYHLDALLPERGFDVARALVGSESTLVTVLHAELQLVPVPAAKAFIVLGFPSIEDAAAASPTIARHDPLSIEGLDSILIENEKRKRENTKALHLLPPGDAWLVVEMPGSSREEADARSQRLLAELESFDPKPAAKIFDDPVQEQEMLDVREAGLGSTAWVPGQRDTWEGWEDAAVPPDRLADYLRDFGALLEEFELQPASRYGHFGQGCVHCRIPFDLQSEQGIDHYRAFIERAAHLVASYDGSLSGEHGDGQSRGALLPIMFGDRVVEAFRELKAVFDPSDLMNPGKVVVAAGGRFDVPLGPTEHLRLGADYRPKVDVQLHFSYPDDEGRFDRAALRCVGVGNCRSHTGGVMCPSYRATGEEEQSTRGRARLLFEMVNGEAKDGPIQDGWRSTEVRDALDLCLSCKGCLSDCPVDVDMATYKAEFLAHHYDGRVRPAAHYSMGWLPLWARLTHVAPGLPGLVNRLGRARGARLAKRLGGVEPDRPLPQFQAERFTDWFAKHPSPAAAPHGEVVLWPDTFTDNFHPHVARAAVTVLENAGYRVVVPIEALCCGLTLVSTGQLASAKRVLARTAHALAPYLVSGTPLVALEPSCLAVFRSDGPELLPADPDIALLRDRARTLAELLLDTPDWEPPLVASAAVVQPHCHQHAVLGFAADETLMKKAGIRAEAVEGCCGLAGNFGFEAGHLDVSVSVAEHDLLPAVRSASPDALVLADGFSCRTQLEHLGEGRTAQHLAEVLAAAIEGASAISPDTSPESRPTVRPRVPRRVVDRALETYPPRTP
ncbi:FAD-binding and (Fe-S)-binding domain-containing protein [Gryllotalpicola protaetiae]|uniref:FAD-binding oxidoreductase n=1 Tax=Gryllotalpicola protaetiae TaxID=2419771 RepID=A0A387BNV1_9MICO|nr:FAD-binding and (Fe-S)-binding domain-containing protein [Gryllotalpicola protaetiae]AYG04388.1 FAD-binding oxidoreductase [Gryllotalpicola protaetiae]